MFNILQYKLISHPYISEPLPDESVFERLVAPEFFDRFGYELTYVESLYHQHNNIAGHVLVPGSPTDAAACIQDWMIQEKQHPNIFLDHCHLNTRYAYEGKAPSSKLQKIFEDFKKWMYYIYQYIQGSEIDVPLSDGMRRIYDQDVYVMRGVYQTQDVDFDLSQFGLFLNNDTLFITFHYNDMIDSFGRKLMNGDVLEVPNLKDYNPLNTAIPLPLPKYYMIQDAAFASEGFAQTWQPHTWRVKATPMTNAQEVKDILKSPVAPENIWDDGNFYPTGSIVNQGDVYYQSVQNVPAGTAITNSTFWREYTPPTASEVFSTRTKDQEINDAILTQADIEVPLSGYDNQKFYIEPTTVDGAPANPTSLTADGTNTTVDGTQGGASTSPSSFGYTQGYLTGDTHAPNGLPVTTGIAFPLNPVTGDYTLRLDYKPNRMFRYDGKRWVKIEDNVRTDLNNGPNNKTQRSSFVNNNDTVRTSDRGTIPSRQSLSEILKPRADNGG